MRGGKPGPRRSATDDDGATAVPVAVVPAATAVSPPTEPALPKVAHASFQVESPIAGPQLPLDPRLMHSLSSLRESDTGSPQTPRTPRTPRIGDPAMAALNAAALQMLNRGTAQAQTYLSA